MIEFFFRGGFHEKDTFSVYGHGVLCPYGSRGE